MEENKPPLEEIKAPSYAEAKARMENIVASARKEIKTEAGGKSILRKTRLNEMTVKRWEDN